MKDKCLNPNKHVLNQTYSIEEIDIDIQRPNIDEQSVFCNTASPHSELIRHIQPRQFLIEKSKLTITKHTISTKSEIKTFTNIPESVPEIVITDWDKNHEAKEIQKTLDSIHSDRIEFKQVSSKIVEEGTIDQFKDIDLFSQTPVVETVTKYPKTPGENKNFVIETMSLNSDIKCKCCASRSTSSHCSRGSYVIVKNTKPAIIQFEHFDSRLEETIETNESKKEDTLCNENNDVNGSEYYLVNPKLNMDTEINNNNNNNDIINKNIEASKLNNYENDEYHLANLKNFQTRQNEEMEPEKARDKAESKENMSLNVSNFSVNSNQTPKIVDKNLSKAVTPISVLNSEEIIKRQDVVTPNKSETDYLYLYVSGSQCTEIFTHGKICLEKAIYDGKIVDGILLLSLPPSCSDDELLSELYGPGVPFDKSRVQCYIKLNRLLFDKSKYLHQISTKKFLCTKRIEFGNKFPKHEFRYRFNKP